MPHDAVTENPQKIFFGEKSYKPNCLIPCQNVLRTLKTFMLPLLMGSIWGRKRTLADKTVYKWIDYNFRPTSVLISTFSRVGHHLSSFSVRTSASLQILKFVRSFRYRNSTNFFDVQIRTFLRLATSLIASAYFSPENRSSKTFMVKPPIILGRFVQI